MYSCCLYKKKSVSSQPWMQCLSCETWLNKLSQCETALRTFCWLQTPGGMLCLYPLRQEFLSCLHYCRIGVQYFLVPSTGGCCIFTSIPAKHSISNLNVNISNFLLRQTNQADFKASVLNPVSVSFLKDWNFRSLLFFSKQEILWSCSGEQVLQPGLL